MSGKGSSPRPFSVDQKTFESNWDLIFNKNKNAQVAKLVDAPDLGSGVEIREGSIPFLSTNNKDSK